MTRILLVLPSATAAGGTERMVSSLARVLGREHAVAVCAFDPVGSRPHFDPGCEFHPLGTVSDLPLPFRLATYLQQARRLSQLKEHLGTEVTISNLWRADLVSQLAGGSDKKIAVCHINIAANPTNRLMYRMLPLAGALYRRFDRVVAVSKPLRDEVQRLYGLHPTSVSDIDNFVDVADGPAAAPAGDRFRLVWCGRFVAEKNLEALLAIFAGLHAIRPAAQLTLIGDGPLFADMKACAAGLGLRVSSAADDATADVLFLGRLADPIPFLRGATMMLLPSLAEGLPVILLEAIALGLPVAAADCSAGGVCSVLLDPAHHNPKRTAGTRSPLGLLLPVPDANRPESVSHWVTQIDAVLNDDGVIRAMRAGALERSRMFSAEAIAPRWHELIAGLSATPAAMVRTAA